MNWKEKVRELMAEKGINQKELSQLSGITEASVCRYLKGDRTPRIDIVSNFARVLGVNVDYLLDDGAEESAYDSVLTVINGSKLSREEKIRLEKILLGHDENV